MTSRKKKTKKTKALGDDPLMWIKAENAPDAAAKNRNTAASKNDADLSGSTSTSADQEDASVALALDPIITISEVNKIFTTFKALLSQDKDISIDASKVQMLDTAGLQLLLCFSQDLKAQRHRIKWVSPSPVFIQSAALAGLSDLLDLP